MFPRRATDLESFGGTEIPCLSCFLQDAISDFRNAESIAEWHEVDSQNKGTNYLTWTMIFRRVFDLESFVGTEVPYQHCSIA